MAARKAAASVLVVLALCAWVAESAAATAFGWNKAGDGQFSAPSNWASLGAPASGPPLTADEADFDLVNFSKPYTVTFSGNVANAKADVQFGDVTFALAGSYSLSGGTGLFVGSVAGQTGRLTLIGGTVAGDVTLGSVLGASGFLTVGSGALLDAGTHPIDVGAVGVGALTIADGGDFTNTASVLVATTATASGALNVTGVGSKLVSGAVVVGNGGAGAATVSAGGLVSTPALTIASGDLTTGSLTVTGTGSLISGASTVIVGNGSAGGNSGQITVTAGGAMNVGGTTIGNAAKGVGSLTVSGAGSTFTSTTGAFVVGNASASSGTLSISNGGTLNSGTSRVAASAGSGGSETVSGAGSTWNAATLAIGGQLGSNGGAGTLAIVTGATVNVSGATELRSSTGTTLTLSGGELNTVDFNRLGVLNFNDGMIHVGGAFTNGAAAGPLVIDGDSDAALPTLRLSGAAAVTNVAALTIGNTRQGALVLDGGRTLNVGANNISIGAGATSSGAVTLSGSGTTLSTAQIIAVGGSGATSGGVGFLTIGVGSSASAGTLNLGSAGTVNLNGGQLNINLLTSAVGGHFNFSSGTVQFTAVGTTTLGGSQLDAVLGLGHILAGGQTISAGDSLALGSALTISGGVLTTVTGVTNDSTLKLQSGNLQTTTLRNNVGRLLEVAGDGALSATGGITNNGTLQFDGNTTATAGGALANSGTIRGSGYVGNNLTNNAAGQVQLTAGNRLVFQGASNTNAGLISLVVGEVQFDGAATNAASTGLISVGEGILRFNGGLSNNGSLVASAGRADIFGNITQGATGRIVVSGGGTATFYGDVANAGAIQVSASGNLASTAVFLGSLSGNGFTGAGQVFLEGDVRPGFSPGKMNFGGDVSLGGAAKVVCEIAGTTALQFDQIHVAGKLSLGGSLQVVLSGFAPSAGQSFDVLDWGSLSGAFSSLSLPALAAGLAWDSSQLYAGGILKVTSTQVAGDFDGNGVVDGADLDQWKLGFGATSGATHAQGDANGDGAVDGADFLAWQRQLGGGVARAASASVPEPTAVLLSVTGFAALFLMTMRRRCAGVSGRMAG